MFIFISKLSDIHVSKFRYVEEIIPQLEEFCDDYIPMINPDLVLVTGLVFHFTFDFELPSSYLLESQC